MLSVMINGQERRELIDLSSLSIENKLTADIDTCSLTLETTDRAQAPQAGQEVIVREPGEESASVPTFTRSSVAYKQDGSQVAANVPRYEAGQFGQAIMVEEGTTNLLKNASFEVYTGTTGVADGWSSASNTTVTASYAVDTVNYRPTGAKSQKIAITASTGSGDAIIFQGVTASAGVAYTLSFYVKGSATGTGVGFIRLQALDSAGTSLGYLPDGVGVEFALPTDWQKITLTVTTPANTATLRFSSGVRAKAADDTVTAYFDDAQLEQKGYSTSIIFANDTTTQATRSPETLTIPTAGVLDPREGNIEVIINPATVQNFNNFFSMSISTGRFLLFFTASGQVLWDYGTINDSIGSAVGLAVAGQPLRIGMAWSASAGTRKLYINGSPVGSKAFVAPTSLPASVEVVNNYGALIDDLRISSRARTDAEILTAYQSTLPLPIDINTAYKLAFDGSLNSLRAKIAFGGRIARTPENESLPGHFAYSVEVTDYTCELDQRRVVESYENMTAGAIIRDLLPKYAPTITAANVKDGPVIQKIRFNYEQPSACLKRLCDIAGYDWYVDYGRGLHFFDRETYAAPFSLIDEGGNYSDLSIEPDLSQVRNRVFVRGGVYASDPFTQTFKGDSSNRAWTLAYKPHAISATTPISVTLNGVAKTLGIENIDDPATKDFLLNYSEKVIKAGTNLATPTSTDTIAVTYRYEVPVLVRVDDPSSQQSLAAITGGDGIYEHLIQDENIKTKELAWQVGQADLAQYANPKVAASFSTMVSGLRAGMLLSVQIARRGLDQTFLITSVGRKPVFSQDGNFVWDYGISCETRLLGIEALLVELLDKSRAAVEREDEVVQRLFNITGDNVQVAEVFTVTQGPPESRIGIALVGYSEVA